MKSIIAIAAGAIVATLLAGEAGATIIAERSGAFKVVIANNADALNFTTTVPFTNVAISAFFGSRGSTPGSGTVYLTDSIGAGTTVADEIDRITLTNIPVATGAEPAITLFTGLTLSAGNYFLILANDTGSQGIGIGGTSVPTETTSAGTSIGSDLYTNDPLALYSPASDFLTPVLNDALFEVTGDAQISTVPEPSTALTLVTAVVGLTAMRRRRKPS